MPGTVIEKTVVIDVYVSVVAAVPVVAAFAVVVVLCQMLFSLLCHFMLCVFFIVTSASALAAPVTIQ